jgi:poly(3-hydroxybutyrate) depolymerase
MMGGLSGLSVCVVCGALLAALLGQFMWDGRSADVKADSILFVRQAFDHTVHLPGAEGAARRRFHFDLPVADHAGGGLSPIIFLIHGKTSNGDDMKTLFGPEAVARARREGFVVVYPVGTIEGEARTWNAGGVHAHNDADDVGYFSSVVRHLAANFNADPRGVFLAGMSNGGFMAHRLACEWADSTTIGVRAIVPTLGGMATMKYDTACRGEMLKMGGVPIPSLRVFNTSQCPFAYWRDAPAHFACDKVVDLPAMLMHGAQDMLVPLSGSLTSDGELYPPVEYTLRLYAEANGCDYAAERTLTYSQTSPDNGEDVTTCHSLQQCRANTTLCVSRNSGHNWVTPTNGIDPVAPSRFLNWLFGPYAQTMDTGLEMLTFFSGHRESPTGEN